MYSYVVKLWGSYKVPVTDRYLQSAHAASGVGYKTNPTGLVGPGTLQVFYAPNHQKFVAASRVISQARYDPSFYPTPLYPLAGWEWVVDHVLIVKPVAISKAPLLSTVAPELRSKIYQGVSFFPIDEPTFNVIVAHLT